MSRLNNYFANDFDSYLYDWLISISKLRDFGQCYCVIVTIGERSATKDRDDQFEAVFYSVKVNYNFIYCVFIY